MVRVTELAERSPGFVWRLKDDSGNATRTLEEAKARIDYLATNGPTAEAFSFRPIFGPPGARETAEG